jgi:2-keto-3-deoxy-L-rhamnonate aldolase RhmA
VGSLDRLRRGEAVFGLFQTFPEASITEVAVWCGYDFVIVDCEHGVVDEAAQINVLRAVSASSAFSLVRVRTRDESAVARYLDFGADGVIVPDVRTPEQARSIAFAATSRWTGGLRFDRYGLQQGSQAERNPLVIVLIESVEGVRNAAAILDVEGISGVIVGSGDLSTNLGKPGDFAAPAYATAVESVESAARARGKILGAKPYPGFPLPLLLERGHRLILIGRDMGLIKNAFAEALAGAKK